MKSLFVVVIMLIAATISTAITKCDNVGEQFPSEDGCNKCICGEDHVLNCTHEDCLSKQECIPGARVTDGHGCNRCTCLANGKLAVCTLKRCPRSQWCKAGDILPAGDGCNNNCTCVRDGVTGSCTLHQCCKPGSVVPKGDGCNTCTCDSSGTFGFCTRRDCFSLDALVM
uniref:Putative pacifastin-like protease inhibitor cvp4 n=1 Tax=Panstrongylus lignarius TaxID=156445 RepID=A0A224XR89_9HEMI